MEFSIGKVKVRSRFANHPGICAGYRLTTSGGSIAYFPDNEPYDLLKLHLADRDESGMEEAREFAKAERDKLVEFLRDVDVLILDAQYTDEEYEKHIGWGHGSLSRVVSLALDAKVEAAQFCFITTRVTTTKKSMRCWNARGCSWSRAGSRWKWKPAAKARKSG